MLFGSEQTRSTASAWAQARDDAKPDAAVSTTHISARNGNPLGLQRMTCYGISWLFTDQHRGCDNPCSAGICNTPWSGKAAEHSPRREFISAPSGTDAPEEYAHPSGP